MNPTKNHLDRRQFTKSLAATASLTAVTPASAAAAPAREFRVWVFGCAHVGTDKKRGRESLAEAIRHSEQGGKQGGPPFDWDIALNLGDLSGNQGSPKDEEGQEVLRQFAAAKKHRREQFYNLLGNHDASAPGEETQWWFRKWIDPTGQNTEVSGVDPRERPYAVDGTWERYALRVGNLLFLMMGDRNDGGPPIGRSARGGYPAGAVTADTFAWWKQQVEGNPEAVVISAHHHMLRETTFASGPYEGFEKVGDRWKSSYHGYFPDGAPQGASYLYWVGGKPDAQAFESYLAEHPAAIDLWLGGHTHSHPDDQKGGRSHVERKWDVSFVNCAALTRYHVGRHSVPMSRLFTFTEGSDQVRVQCYLHTNTHAPQGWYQPAERTLPLTRPFERI